MTPFFSPEYAFLLLSAIVLLLRAIEELLNPGLWASGAYRWSRSGPAMTPQAGTEQHVATIYLRAGKLVLRRRRAA
jgi:hypothetical protein